MTFQDLKNNEKLLIHLTLTDTALFVKRPEYSRKIDEILDKRSFDAYKVDFQRMVSDKKVTSFQRDAFIRSKKEEFARDNILKVLEEHEEWIDVEKYLLTTAYRIKNLLALLEDPKNKAVFPHYDDFLPYRKTFAETAKEVNRLLQGKNVVLYHKAKYGKDAEGYWDDVTQTFIDTHYTSEDLARDVEEGPIKRALELESHVTQEELEDFFSEVRTVPTTNPDVAPADLREYIEQMAANNPNIKVINVGEEATKKPTLKAPSSKAELFETLRGIKSAQEQRAREQNERENNVIANALKNNGIMQTGKDRLIAVYEGEEVELDSRFVERMRENTREDLMEHSESLVDDFSPKDAYAIIYKYDTIAALGMQNDLVILETLIGMARKIINRGENDFAFYNDYLYNLSVGLPYLKEAITYENAAKVTPNSYIKKYGETNAVKRKYDELLKLHRDKLITLYQYAFVPLHLLIEDGAITNEIGHKELFEYLDKDNLDKVAVRAAIMASAGLTYDDEEYTDEYIEKLYRTAKADKKKKNTYVTRKYLELLPKSRIINMFVENESLVDRNDLRKFEITVSDVLSLDLDSFMNAVKSGKLPENIRPKEEDILKGYGLGLFREEVLDLANEGVVSDKSILELFVSRKSVEVSEPDKALRAQDVLGFYNTERLLKLKQEDAINSKFVVGFKEGVLNTLDQETRKEYVGKIIADLKAIDEKEESESPRYLAKLYEFYELGLFDKSDVSAEFNDEKIEELLMDDVIAENEVVKYFNDDLASLEILKEVFTSQEIRNLVLTGELVPKAVLAIEGKREEILKDLVQKEGLEIVDVLDLYLDTKNGLNVDEFEAAIEGQELEDGYLVDLIPDDADEGKIEELFKKYLISQDDLSLLVSRGVISAEKEKELSNYLNSHQEFEKIFGATRTVAKLTEVTDGTGESYTPGLRGEGDPRKRQVKNDPELIRKLLKDLGADPRVVYLEGADNSLDGYEVHGIEDLGVMVFGKFDKPSNAIFIMTIGQGSYFLKSLERRKASKQAAQEEEKEIILESSATKRELKNTDHVKYRVACGGLGRNIIESISELNPAIDEKLKDKKYKAQIDSLVQEIKDDYEIRREIG